MYVGIDKVLSFFSGGSGVSGVEGFGGRGFFSGDGVFRLKGDQKDWFGGWLKQWGRRAEYSDGGCQSDRRDGGRGGSPLGTGDSLVGGRHGGRGSGGGLFEFWGAFLRSVSGEESEL